MASSILKFRLQVVRVAYRHSASVKRVTMMFNPDTALGAGGPFPSGNPRSGFSSWRALRGGLQDSGQPAMPAQSLAIARVRNRIAAEGKRKGRFSEH
jgi:hypothetical protein